MEPLLINAYVLCALHAITPATEPKFTPGFEICAQVVALYDKEVADGIAKEVADKNAHDLAIITDASSKLGLRK